LEVADLTRESSPEATLQITEAAQCDVGIGIARMSSADMRRLALTQNDVIVLGGTRHTVARVQAAEIGTVEDHSLRIDGILRCNAGRGIGEQITVRKAAYQAARRITLVPAANSRGVFHRQEGSFFARLMGKPGRRTNRTDRVQDTKALRLALNSRAVTSGDRLRANLFGRPLDFTVAATVPQGAVVLERATTISLDLGGAVRTRGPAVSYEDIGGLSKEITRVREMIELPLRYPEVFERLGVDAPKGVLLYGPPGCGKTLIARAVAYEAGVRFVSINGPEIIQQGYGESEALLRKIFHEAQESPPTIIFFDEIDALAPSRDTVLGDVEKRVVAQLLALMDGLNSRGKVIIIAATNLPNNIDPALRRPGRFDREIGLSPPDKAGRFEILQVHTRGMPRAADVDLERIAAATHGFLGADLAALCRESAMLCARDLIPNLDLARNGLPADALRSMRVTMKHFEQAMNEIELSTTRQVFTEVPDVKWGEVGGLDEIKLVLREAVEWPLKYPDRFAHARTAPPKGVLLVGPPGTGKTLVAKALASESGVNFISVKGPQILSKWVGESERGIREIFKKARQAAPCIIFFDEIDAIVPVRGHGGGGGHISERLVGQFLLELDGVDELKGVLVLGATNRCDLIDPALLRPGRFDVVVELPQADLATRRAILAIHCRGRILGSDVCLAKTTEGLTGAELGALCRRAATLAIRDSILREGGKEFSPFAVERRHFDAALGLIRAQISRRDVLFGQQAAGELH
jgi:transitional endoplasmic reticulum ATPase